MRVIGINASPRKKANTHTLVEAILGGAEEKGAEKYEIFHQYGTGIERKTARNDPEILNKAKKLGAGLISST